MRILSLVAEFPGPKKAKLLVITGLISRLERAKDDLLNYYVSPCRTRGRLHRYNS